MQNDKQLENREDKIRKFKANFRMFNIQKRVPETTQKEGKQDYQRSQKQFSENDTFFLIKSLLSTQNYGGKEIPSNKKNRVILRHQRQSEYPELYFSIATIKTRM